ncbi:methyltransferase domain-containing protein [Nonomuraea sp. NPDC049725]|uniref:class I SAM-dependent methyltransferase n=1 Tax=Nonomuraea sp. NPDC049725 TaxID=3154508 RepID=UPI0034170218
MTIDQITRDANVYGDDISEIYDLLYLRRGKDYAGEADIVTSLVRERVPHADSLLDVACGTGEHLRTLRTRFSLVEGVELSAAMRARAQAKLPGVAVHPGDIRDFRLGRVFDAVCSLYSTVGYMAGTEELDAAVASMGRHVAPGGVLIVEPWYFKDGFADGHIGDDVVREDGRTIARVARSSRVGDTVRVEAHYLVADGAGVRHFEHTQVMNLFSRAEYAAAFERAGFTAECLEETGPLLAGRSLFLGVRRDG